jgi:hypothetical protein
MPKRARDPTLAAQRVMKRMAPINSVLGSQALPTVGGRILGKLPVESKLIRNAHTTTRKATVTDPPDLKMDKRLRDAVALTQANSPLDANNRESLSHLPRHYNHLRKNIRGKPRGLYKPRKLTKKGGFIFTTLKNVTVNP